MHWLKASRVAQVPAHAFYILCGHRSSAGSMTKCKIKKVAQHCGSVNRVPLRTKQAVDLGQWAHCRLNIRPLTSKSVAVVLCKAGHGHGKTAYPQNYNCHTRNTPNHCSGNGSSCSGHANAGYCARTDGTPNPLPAVAVAFCHRNPDGSNGASSGG